MRIGPRRVSVPLRITRTLIQCENKCMRTLYLDNLGRKSFNFLLKIRWGCGVLSNVFDSDVRSIMPAEMGKASLKSLCFPL